MFKHSYRVAIVVFLVIILALFGCGKKVAKKKPKRQHKLLQANKPKPRKNLSPCPFDGVKVDPALARQQPLAIMVENLKSIRPQYGIAQSCLVVEGLAEGGITRFMVVYGHRQAKKIGPVRSARSHFVALAKGWKAVYGHAGGSKYALNDIRNWEVDDFDEFAHDNGYWRDRSIRAPHNLFTSTSLIRKVKKTSLGNFPGFSFVESPLSKSNKSVNQTVEIKYKQQAYRVKWVYQPKGNNYLRFNGGLPHLDADTKKQLTATNILILYTETSVIPGGSVLDIKMTGSGRLTVIKDGKVINGNWYKPTVDSQLTLEDDFSNPIRLRPGRVWIEIVPVSTQVNISTDGSS